MGGYSPGYEGESAGLKLGLSSDLEIWKHTEIRDDKVIHANYYIGFGVGFTKGQQYRSRLRNVSSGSDLIEKSKALIWLSEKTFERFHFTKFEQAVMNHLAQPNAWDTRELPLHIYKRSRDLIETGQLQRAFNRIDEYYEENLNLLSRIALESISSELKNIRFSKRANKLFNSKAALSKVEEELTSWLEKHKQEE